MNRFPKNRDKISLTILKKTLGGRNLKLSRTWNSSTILAAGWALSKFKCWSILSFKLICLFGDKLTQFWWPLSKVTGEGAFFYSTLQKQLCVISETADNRSQPSSTSKLRTFVQNLIFWHFSNLLFFPTFFAEGEKINKEQGIGFGYATSQTEAAITTKSAAL